MWIIQLSSIFIIYLLGIVNAQDNVQWSYKLTLRRPNQNSLLNSGNDLAIVFYNGTSIQLITINEQPLLKNFDSENLSGWCVSLVSNDDDGVSKTSFPCFNYFGKDKTYNQLLGGELVFSLDENNFISNVNYFLADEDAKNAEITLRWVYPARLNNPQPRLKLAPHDKSVDETDVEISGKEMEKGKGKKTESKLGKNQNDIVADDAEDADATAETEFQEIVKPKGIYGDDQTYIEKYWMYILPPVVILFIMGNASS